MDFADKTGRASMRRADPAPGYLPAATIADLTGTDTKGTHTTKTARLTPARGHGERYDGFA